MEREAENATGLMNDFYEEVVGNHKWNIQMWRLRMRCDIVHTMEEAVMKA